MLSAGESAKGCAAFRVISHNVEREESAVKEDDGVQDVHYSEVQTAAYFN